MIVQLEIEGRLYMESDLYGREYFGPYDSDAELREAAKRLRRDATAQTRVDGVDREVGIVFEEVVEDDS